jgi:hypothetical protein
MTDAPPKIREYMRADRAIFETEIAESGQPAVFRGLVSHWPAVSAGKAGASAMGDYLKSQESGTPAMTLIARPEEGGRYFYSNDMAGFNFETRQITLSKVIDKLHAIADDPNPIGIYAGSAEAKEVAPAFASENIMPLLPPEKSPRLWLGNASRVAAHYDTSRNIACCVAGRRRFTLFPPAQIANLYIGPLEHTMAGPPASMVDFANPDYDKYPKFRDAQNAALVVELEPGDAVFIPSLWWHHVESFGPFSLLANFWWNVTEARSGFEAMALAMLDIRDQPPAEKAAWKDFFDHYVFGADAAKAADHLPERWRTVSGPASQARADQIESFIIEKMQKRPPQ